MLKVFHIAARDFKATVFTKAFLIGALVPPLIMLVAIPLVTMLVKNEPPPVKGRVGLWSKTDSTSDFKDYVVTTR